VADKGWNARGKIRPLWQQLDGPAKREQLAEISGVRATELSAHNNGKPLGAAVAQKIIDGLATRGITVSRLELGAPIAEADEQGQTFLDLLAELRAVVEAQGVKTNEALDRLHARVDALEARRGRSTTKPKKAQGG
jgi:type II secretory pathway component PulM